MEFVPLRDLQRGMPKIHEALRKEKGRIVLTNKGQPAYLLIDLTGKNIINLVNFFDYYQSNVEAPAKESAAAAEQMLTPQEKAAAQNFLASMQIFRKKNMTPEVQAAFTELENGKYKLKSLRS